MVFLVPFDGSSVSEAALARAVEHGRALEKPVVAVSIIPTGDTYAERRKWIQPDEEFAVESASAELRRKIEETTDDAERTFAETGAYSPDDGLTGRVRQIARDVDASVLFVGSGDGTSEAITTPFGDVAAEAEYDIHIVRTA
jgi:nucleotide-binding universal stress UspA family protein